MAKEEKTWRVVEHNPTTGGTITSWVEANSRKEAKEIYQDTSKSHNAWERETGTSHQVRGDSKLTASPVK
jgi:hypothetical protein